MLYVAALLRNKSNNKSLVTAHL